MIRKNLFCYLLIPLSVTACVQHLPREIVTSTVPNETSVAQTTADTAETPVAAEEYALPEGTLVWTDASMTRTLPAGATYADPWDYCQAVGTIDTPGPEYTGTNPPEVIKKEVLRALAISESDGTAHNVVWRCVDGQVFGCDSSMYQTCLTSMNLSTTPPETAVNECAKAEMDNITLPGAVVGNDTPYEWTCQGGKPVITGQGVTIDEQGYNALIWYPVPRQ